MCLGVEATGESGELAGRTDHPVTWNYNRNGIAPIRGSDSPARGWSPELFSDLTIAQRRAKWDRL
jgi:hypothetical protein